MAVFQVEDVTDATVAVMAALLNMLKKKGVLNNEELADVLNGAMADSESKPNKAQIRAIIHMMVKN